MPRIRRRPPSPKPWVKKAAKSTSSRSNAAAASVGSGARRFLGTSASRGKSATNRVAEASRPVTERARAGGDIVAGATTAAATRVLTTTQTLLASNLSGDVNNMLAGIASGPATIYDKAMDARYLDPLLKADLGGSYHRLFDGGHTIAGAITAGHDASADDHIVQEALGTMQGLLRDGVTTRGLPLANWDKSTFDSVAGFLETTYGIPKAWFYDLNTYDAAELLGGTVGAVAVALNWKRAESEDFARLVGSIGLSAALDLNPLLLVVTVVALAMAFQKAHATGDYAAFVDGNLKGTVSTGATLTAVALVGTAGGPAGLALLAGIAAGVLARSATKRVSVSAVSQFAAERAVAVASGGRERARTLSVPGQLLRTAHCSSPTVSGRGGRGI